MDSRADRTAFGSFTGTELNAVAMTGLVAAGVAWEVARPLQNDRGATAFASAPHKARAGRTSRASVLLPGGCERLYKASDEMQPVGQLQNLPPRLQAVFEAFPDVVPPSGEQQPVEGPASSPKRLGNGVVQRAVAKVLAASAQPMRVVAIQTPVEALLGQPVSYGSVSWCLRTGSRGDGSRFERASYYCYRLR